MPSTDWREKILPDEAERFARFAEIVQAVQRENAPKNDGTLQRAFHAKPHAALRARFRVLAGLADPFRQGLFAHPGEYDSWVRISNGNGVRGRDRMPDSRGIAVKVLEAPGPAIDAPDAERHTQDFLTMNLPVQPAADIDEFMVLVDAARSPVTAPFKMVRKLGVVRTLQVMKGIADLIVRVRSVATTSCWSALPIRYGPYAAKYQLQATAQPRRRRGGGRDELRRDLIERLREAPLRWNFLVQLYVDAERTPIEDASVEWLPEHSPFVKVGELVVAPREMTSDSVRGEEEIGNSLSYSPWNCGPAHRPLGSLMRARGVVYRASADLRGSGGTSRSSTRCRP